MHKNLILIFTVLIFTALSTLQAQTQDDPKAEYANAVKQIKEIDKQMQGASEAGDRTKYDELAAKREKLAQKIPDLKAKADAVASQEKTNVKSKIYFNDAGKKMSAGDFPGAIDLYKQSLELDSNNPSAYYNMGFAYIRLKKTAEARWD